MHVQTQGSWSVVTQLAAHASKTRFCDVLTSLEDGDFAGIASGLLLTGASLIFLYVEWSVLYSVSMPSVSRFYHRTMRVALYYNSKRIVSRAAADALRKSSPGVISVGNMTVLP